MGIWGLQIIHGVMLLEWYDNISMGVTDYTRLGMCYWNDVIIALWGGYVMAVM